jgi:hypothetical protein
VNWVAAGVIVSGVVSVLASVIGYVNSRKADKSASTSRTIELGVKDLIDQYQEANEELRTEVTDCKGECAALRKENAALRAEVSAVKEERETMERRLDNLEAELIRLKRKAGEL